MVILQDSRETSPLLFPKNYKYLEGVEVTKLDVGDYMCKFKDGFIAPISIERKSLCDLFGTLSSGYERFSREVNRAQESGIILVLTIEEDLYQCRNGHEFSKRSGESVIDQVMTLWIKHGLYHQFFCSRAQMAYWIYKLFYSIGKLYITDKLAFKTITPKRLKELL